MMKYFKSSRGLVIFTTITLIITTAFFVTYSLFVGWVTNALFEESIDLIIGVAAVAGFLVSSFLILYVQNLLINTMVARIRLSMQKDLAENLLRQKESVSGVLNIYGQEIDMVLDGYIRNFPWMFNLLFGFILATIYALIISWQITLGMVVISVISVGLNHLYKGKLSSALNDFRSKNQAINADANGYFSNTRMINFFGANNFVLNKFNKTLDASNKSFKANQMLNRRLSVINQTIANFVTIAVILIGFWLAGTEIITVGAVLALMTLSPHIRAPFYQMMDIKNEMDATKEIRVRLEQIINMQTDEPIVDFGRHDIEFQDVSFSYVDSEEGFISNLNCTFEMGKKYLLLGKSGSGKSTLLDMILRENVPNGGKIMYGADSLGEIPLNSWYKKVGYVDQKANIIPGTLRENITLGNPNIKHSLAEIAEIFNLLDLADSLDDMLHEDLGNFSGGELQRVEIARTIYKDSDIMLFDEPLSALDPKNAYAVESYITNLDSKMIINVSHRINESLLTAYDKIMLMDKGRVVYFGSYANDREGVLGDYIKGS